MLKFIAKHKIAAILAVTVLGGGGYYAYRSANPTVTETSYVYGTVEKGTLVIAVSGSGQVTASNQVDVKARATGDAIAVSVKLGDTVKANQVIAQLNASDAQKAVRDAQTSLESANLSLDKLNEAADGLSILQSENSLSSAERALQQAQDTLDQLAETSAQEAATAYEDGYNAVSNAYLDMPEYMKDLKDLRGTAEPDANVQDFKNILGENSTLISAWLRDHDTAKAAFDVELAFFKTVQRTSSEALRYELISRTALVEAAISQALLSAHAMLDAVVNTTYKQYTIAATVDSSRSKIASGISGINANLSATKNAKDTLDSNARNFPIDLKKAQDALIAAENTVEERKASLAKLKEGTDPNDIRSQEIVVRQRQEALSDARAKLADYVMRAPFDGVIAALNVKKGDSVSSGTVIATLITEQRIAELSLNEIDAADVKPGQKSTLTFDAVEDLSLTGTVSEIDAIGTVSQGVVTYMVRIGLDSQDERVKPGMSVSASIVTDVKQDVLLVPSSAVKAQNDQNYVEVSSDGVVAPTRHTVVVGASNDTMTEIVSGLSEGDQVVVRTVTTTSAAASGTATQSRSILQTGGGAGTGGVRFQTGGGGFQGR